MNLNRIVCITGMALSLGGTPVFGQNQERITTTKNRVERVIDGGMEGFKIGENILLYPEVANPNLLLDPSVIPLYEKLLEKSRAKQIYIYAFDQAVIRTKQGVGYVVKVDFIEGNSGGNSVYYFVTSRPNITRLSSDNLSSALKEVK